jgi:hypothetical protein
MSSHSYIPLASSPTHGEDEMRSRPTKRAADWSLILAVIVCIICTVVNVFFLSPSSSHVHASDVDLNKLRRPSQFIGFETINRSSFTEKEFINHPLSLTQVGPDAKAPTKSHFSVIGTIDPGDRQGRVTKKVSSLVLVRS